jgi:hypothetical protein
MGRVNHQQAPHSRLGELKANLISKVPPDREDDALTERAEIIYNDLPDEDQIAFAAFVDWFYNRVLHTDVPFPYNFTKGEKWQQVFATHGMRLVHTIHLGKDINTGPEYHVLFVLEQFSGWQNAHPQAFVRMK